MQQPHEPTTQLSQLVLLPLRQHHICCCCCWQLQHHRQMTNLQLAARAWSATEVMWQPRRPTSVAAALGAAAFCRALGRDECPPDGLGPLGLIAQSARYHTPVFVEARVSRSPLSVSSSRSRVTVAFEKKIEMSKSQPRTGQRANQETRTEKPTNAGQWTDVNRESMDGVGETRTQRAHAASITYLTRDTTRSLTARSTAEAAAMAWEAKARVRMCRS